jgi:hypothetical protein
MSRRKSADYVRRMPELGRHFIVPVVGKEGAQSITRYNKHLQGVFGTIINAGPLRYRTRAAPQRGSIWLRKLTAGGFARLAHTPLLRRHAVRAYSAPATYSRVCTVGRPPSTLPAGPRQACRRNCAM